MESCHKGTIIQRNYGKMTISWSQHDHVISKSVLYRGVTLIVKGLIIYRPNLIKTLICRTSPHLTAVMGFFFNLHSSIKIFTCLTV